MIHHPKEVQGLEHKNCSALRGPAETYIEVILQSTSLTESLSTRSQD